MISDEKVKQILELIIEKEMDMAQDKENYRTNKDKEIEVKKIIERLVEKDEV